MRVRRIVDGHEYAELSDNKDFEGVCTATVGRQGNGSPKSEIALRVLGVATAQRAPVSVFAPLKP